MRLIPAVRRVCPHCNSALLEVRDGTLSCAVCDRRAFRQAQSRAMLGRMKAITTWQPGLPLRGGT